MTWRPANKDGVHIEKLNSQPKIIHLKNLNLYA